MQHANDQDLHAAIDRHTSPRRSALCAWCGHDHRGRTAAVEPSWLAVVPEGALTEGDVVCAGCGTALASEAADAALDADPEFVTVCDARRDGWIAALEGEVRTVTCSCCGKPVPWFAVDTDGRCDECPATSRRAA